jgi:hypothetical protein
MPRQAAASRPYAVNGSTRAMLQPPADLDELEKAEFVSLVLGAPPSHFVPSDLPLLACYAKAIVAERVASGELAACPVVSSPNGDRPSPWLPIWQSKVRALSVLGRLLALNPAGRVPTKSEPLEPINHYSRIALEQQKRDEPN